MLTKGDARATSGLLWEYVGLVVWQTASSVGGDALKDEEETGSIPVAHTRSEA